jgi:hypothetical protein
MATYSRAKLSSSTSGKGILVAGTTTGNATTIHTAVAGSTDMDELNLYASNNSASNVKLTIEYGGTGAEDNIELTVTAEAGLVLVVPGLMLNGGLVVKAFAATANVVTVHGYVNQIRN